MEYPVTLYHETEGTKMVASYEEEAHLLENHWSRKPTLAGLSRRMDALEARLAVPETPRAKGKS